MEAKTEIDYKKIFALHNAGWSRKKITDEMRMTPEEYYDALTGRLDILDARIRRNTREYRLIARILTGV